MTRKWINGRNILLSGCSTGIGRELCRQLVLKYGCNVVGIARNLEKLQSLKEELGDKFTFKRFDISKREEWEKLAKELEEKGFAIDILINNAGMIQPFTQFADLTDEQLERVNKTNYESIINSCKIFIPYIKRSSYGGIINIASASAILPVAGESIYSSSKCGVRGLTEALSQELRGFGIFVECVMPGPVKTDIYKSRKEGGEKKVKDSFIENIGVTAEKAAKKIIGTIKRRKSRFVLGGTAKMMDLGMRFAPRFTCWATGASVKWLGKKYVKSFYPIYQEQIENKKNIKELKKLRKKCTYNKKNAPVLECLKNKSL